MDVVFATSVALGTGRRPAGSTTAISVIAVGACQRVASVADGPSMRATRAAAAAHASSVATQDDDFDGLPRLAALKV